MQYPAWITYSIRTYLKHHVVSSGYSQNHLLCIPLPEIELLDTVVLQLRLDSEPYCESLMSVLSTRLFLIQKRDALGTYSLIPVTHLTFLPVSEYPTTVLILRSNVIYMY